MFFRAFLAWAYLEPREGQFDWPVIDRIIEKWTAHGLGIAFRISCRETSADRAEQQFATPRWVMDAGAKGSHVLMGKPTGPEGPWEPVYDDPVFLAKVDKFLAAFAARYELALPADLMPGDYALSIGLFSLGDGKERPVELAVKVSARDAEGYYQLATVTVAASR